MGRVSVSGHRGFIGSHMVSFLQGKGYSVHTHTGDLRNLAIARELVSGVDLVFHFAADMGGVGYFSEEQYQPFVTNMQIDLNVLKACEMEGVSRLFYASSACAYPTHLQTGSGLSEEELVPANADQMYGWEKLILTLLSEFTPFETRVGLFHTIFGPGQAYTDKKAKFPAQIAYKALQSKRTGEPIEVWGDGTQTRTFLYIDDAIEKIFEVATVDHYHGPVNISSNEVVSVRECVEWCCEYLRIPSNIRFDLTKPTGVQSRGVNSAKFKSLYTYRDRISTKEGFHRLLDYFQSNI